MKPRCSFLHAELFHVFQVDSLLAFTGIGLFIISERDPLSAGLLWLLLNIGLSSEI